MLIQKQHFSLFILKFSKNVPVFKWQLYCYYCCPVFTQSIRIYVSFFVQTHTQNTLRVKTTVLPTTMTRYASYPFPRYHNKLIGAIEKRLRNFSAFCFTNQNVNFPLRTFKYRINDKIVAKSGQVIDNMQTEVYFQQGNWGTDRILASPETESQKKHQ